MTTYINESLEKINKRDMINIALFLQSKLDEANKHVLEGICKLYDAFLKLQSGLAVSQQVNSLLSKRLTNMERQCWENAQYARRECLDVIDIPVKWMHIFWRRKSSTSLVRLIAISLQSELKSIIESAKKSSTVIAKFTKRKDCQQVWSVKRDLQK